MPRVKIDTPGVTIELDANETSVGDLGKQALDMFAQATAIHHRTPTGPATTVYNEKRHTADHTDPNYRGGLGFKPVKS